MTYPFVAAQYFTAGGFRELRGFVIHMAEGGGTVSWLTHPTNDNSSDYVVEYSGRIVQMVRDADASHSLHVHRPYGPPGLGDYGTFSLDAAAAVLGTGISDPNRYIKVVELEGFAAIGPNAAQVASLKVLIADLRARFPTMRGLLGHRDFQNYKPCPGGAIPWSALGGHGVFSTPGTVPGAPTDMSYALRVREYASPRPFRLAAGTILRFYDPNRPGKAVYQAVFAGEFTGFATGEASVDWRNLGSNPRPVPDSGGAYAFTEIGEVTPFPQGGVAADTYKGLLVVTATPGFTVAP